MVGLMNPPSTDPVPPMYQSAARTAIALIGGYLIGRGYFTAETWATFSGAVVTLVPLGFGIYAAWHAKQQIRTAYTLSAAAEPPQ